MDKSSAQAYWRANRLLIGILLAVWALVSYVFAILLARPLYTIHVGRLPMSFWWAQQGSIIVFVILIFVYAKVMDRIDRQHGMHEEDDK
jgi:putative solute:sodium symporter small subunit